MLSRSMCSPAITTSCLRFPPCPPHKRLTVAVRVASLVLQEIEKIYEPECSKLVEFKKLGSARFELIQKVRCQKA